MKYSLYFLLFVCQATSLQCMDLNTKLTNDQKQSQNRRSDERPANFKYTTDEFVDKFSRALNEKSVEENGPFREGVEEHERMYHINRQNSQGMTVLHAAINNFLESGSNGYKLMIAVLLECGARVDADTIHNGQSTTVIKLINELLKQKGLSELKGRALYLKNLFTRRFPALQPKEEDRTNPQAPTQGPTIDHSFSTIEELERKIAQDLNLTNDQQNEIQEVTDLCNRIRSYGPLLNDVAQPQTPQITQTLIVQPQVDPAARPGYAPRPPAGHVAGPIPTPVPPTSSLTKKTLITLAGLGVLGLGIYLFMPKSGQKDTKKKVA